jgi:hypothetical protein
MSLLVYAFVVIILLALVLYGIRLAPIEAPFSLILQLIAVVIAVLVIANRAGMF